MFTEMRQSSDKDLRKLASSPRPKAGTKEYSRWYRARRILGLKTSAENLTSDYRAYMRDYMRRRREIQ